jgi:ribosomal protein S18 acetylase RimI-like enzyme
MLHNEITIAPATRDDIPAIWQMLRALGAALNRADGVQSTPEDLARFGFDSSPAFEGMIARRERTPVGLAIYFFEFSTWRGARGVYLQDVYVAEEVRGSGVGRRLLSAVAERARMQDARYMRLSTHAENISGLGFYERLGFVSQHEHVLVVEGQSYDAL